jgi:Lar family restriction alleviation protein
VGCLVLIISARRSTGRHLPGDMLKYAFFIDLSEVRMEEIKPCPFCGGEAWVCRTGILFYISCKNYECGANYHTKPTRKEAIQAWNQRKADNKYKKMWEHLKATYKQVICPAKTGELEVMRLIEEKYK